RKDDPEVHQAVAAFWQQARQSGRSLNLVDWSFVTEAALQIFTLYQDKDSGTTQVTAQWRNREVEIKIPFTDEASVENAIHCWCVLLHLEFPDADIQQHMLLLERVAMRLELNKGIHHCTLINDSYSNDLNSLKIALEFLAQQAHHEQRTVILSDFLQTSMPEKELYPEAAALLSQYQVHRFIGIGERWWAHQQVFPAGKVHRKSFFRTTEAFLKELHPVDFKEETILLKGARPFSFESIHRVLELQQHQTVLEVNLTSLAANLQKYQQLLQPGTRMMVMVKALAYGSGSVDVARILQYHKVDYLAVAYADEGVTLREGGIWLPILVMNPEPTAYENILQHSLEPALYSQHTIQNFVHYLSSQGLQQYPVHLELETGMHRLGLSVEEVENLC
ncbi:MAG: alanine racemase, partial [Chitinophagaceae bacterium]